MSAASESPRTARMHSEWVRFAAFACCVSLAAAAVRLGAFSEESEAVLAPAFADAGRSESFPANSWVEIVTSGAAPPRYRTDHGGAVYDPDRDSVFLFGSDTHLRDFDNRMYELGMEELRWYQPYRRAPRYTLRTDAAGVRVAGGRGDKPWPMHVYDAMVYDRAGRRIVVLSGAKHNFVAAPGRQLDPVWAYAAGENAWRRLGRAGDPAPNAFASAAVYDPGRDAIIVYAPLAEPVPFVPLAGETEVPRSGVWELGPERERWQLASEELHHSGLFNAEFDVAHRALVVLGGHQDDPSIWVYEVGEAVGHAGRWERRVPRGDRCPGGHYFPAAYDTRRHLTLFMPYDAAAGRTVTCVFDLAANTVRRLPAADLPNVGLSYTMVYVERRDVFLLVTGSFSRGVSTRTWALKLDPDALD